MEFTKEINFNTEPTANESLSINYNGFLGNSAELAIVYGFGDSWEYTSEAKMEKTTEGFTAHINLLDYDKLNFCFRNSNNEWDNNSYNNYICSISPATENEVVIEHVEASGEATVAETTPKFDIDALLDEMLEPLTIKASEENIDFTANVQAIDLGVEISNLLSQINDTDSSDDLKEYSSLEEILSGSVFEETPIDLFAEEDNKEATTTSLINVENKFTVSPRKLSAFYLFRKRIKLAFYKALVKIPKLIFGSQEQ